MKTNKAYFVKKKLSIIGYIFSCLLLVAGCLALNMSALTQKAFAASPDSCTPPATTYGTDSWSSTNTPADPVYIPQTGIYTISVRMQAASASANSILLNIDGTNCYNVGGDSSIPNGSWDWVNYYGGDASDLMNVSLTQGNHNFTLTGTESGVEIDRIIAIPTTTVSGTQTQTPSCTPTDTQDDTAGDNCAPINNTSSGPPTVSVASPTSGTVSGTTTITANAADADPGNSEEGIASVQFLLDGSPLPDNSNDNPAVVPSSGSTYSYSWDTSAVSNGTHTLSALATDDSGATTTSSSVTITVDNSTGSLGTLTAPTNVAISARTGLSLSLSWSASTDSGGPGVVGYHIYQNGSSTPLTSVSGTTYIDHGLTAGTSYSYTVAAYNNAATNNISAKSSSVNNTTCILGDIKCNGGPVGLPDLLVISQNWNNNSGTATWAQGSLTGNGDVGLPDLLILSQHWNSSGQ